jgi:hypothetical protein
MRVACSLQLATAFMTIPTSNTSQEEYMFKRSDFFIIGAVMLSFFISAYLWFVVKDQQQAIFTAIWIPSIFTFGIYFKLCALMGQRK